MTEETNLTEELRKSLLKGMKEIKEVLGRLYCFEGDNKYPSRIEKRIVTVKDPHILKGFEAISGTPQYRVHIPCADSDKAFEIAMKEVEELREVYKNKQYDPKRMEYSSKKPFKGVDDDD